MKLVPFLPSSLPFISIPLPVVFSREIVVAFVDGEVDDVAHQRISDAVDVNLVLVVRGEFQRFLLKTCFDHLHCLKKLFDVENRL